DVVIVAADVADRGALETLLEQVRRARPIGAVFHLAGLLDDGLVASQTPERLARVMGAKAVGALNLDVLAAPDPLAAFVLFSSAAGTVGSPGQSTYAAANAFLDALAAARRGQGRPATSLAWGPWTSGMTTRLSAADRARLRRQGLVELDEAEALHLLD